tara:strand:+ start:320 stop:670 length:351 start_codon:yes stop_codon:yes gene_type:complete
MKLSLINEMPLSKIARMITEDPDEVVPSDHFDDFEDEYEDYDYYCDNCNAGFDPWAPELLRNNEAGKEFSRIYDEVYRLSNSMAERDYPILCSSDCAREQRDKLKIDPKPAWRSGG